MLDHIESYLAAWTGRASWPITNATLASRLIIPNDGETHFASKFALFTYEVNGDTYSAAIREIAGNQDRPSEAGDVASIQYDPRKPARFYYAPSCPLASKLIVGLSLTAALMAITLTVYWHTLR